MMKNKYDNPEYPMACEYLNQVKEAEDRVVWLRERAENMKMCLTDTSVHMTKMPHSDSPDQQKILTSLAEVDEMQGKIAEAKMAAEAVRLEVGKTVCQLNDPVVQKALLLHYVEMHSWREVAKDMGYSVTHVTRLRDAGYAELEEMLAAS